MSAQSDPANIPVICWPGAAAAWTENPIALAEFYHDGDRLLQEPYSLHEHEQIPILKD